MIHWYSKPRAYPRQNSQTTYIITSNFSLLKTNMASLRRSSQEDCKNIWSNSPRLSYKHLVHIPTPANSSRLPTCKLHIDDSPYTNYSHSCSILSPSPNSPPPSTASPPRLSIAGFCPIFGSSSWRIGSSSCFFGIWLKDSSRWLASHSILAEEPRRRLWLGCEPRDTL